MKFVVQELVSKWMVLRKVGLCRRACW